MILSKRLYRLGCFYLSNFCSDNLSGLKKPFILNQGYFYDQFFII